MSEDIVTGGCLCGAYRYQFDRGAVLTAAHCHCTDCQKATGSGKATIVFLPAEALIAQGVLREYSVTGSDGGEVNRAFCPQCGSQVLSHVTQAPQLRFIKAGSLDDSSWVRVDSSYWRLSATPWSPVDEAIPAFDGNPH